MKDILLRILLLVVLIVLGQAFCFYLWWIEGTPWELIPRTGLMWGCAGMFMGSVWLGLLLPINRKFIFN